MKIICFGDSLTRGVSFNNGRLRILKDNYPGTLQELFRSNENDHAGDSVDVLNKGVFNDNSDTLLTRLEKDVLAEAPEFVIIGIGGNDCNFQWKNVAAHPDDEHQAVVPLDRYVDNLKDLLTKVKQHGVTPVLLTLPPLDPVRYYDNIVGKFSSKVSNWICRSGGIEHWHGLYNRSLTKAAEELDVFKIDVRSALKQAGDLIELVSADGIHLTAKGYRVLGAEIHRHIQSVIEEDHTETESV